MRAWWRWPVVTLVVSVAAVLGCKQPPAPSSRSSASGPAATPSPRPDAGAVTAADAGARAAAHAGAAGVAARQPGAPPPGTVELLHRVPSVVAVSSRVANLGDRPEHIVDGQLDTAWNSRTGELAGAWVAFRVPASAQVKAIRLTAGYVHQNQDGDLFTMNHRIARVRIEKVGGDTHEARLDVERRDLQLIPFAAGGGDFKITVLETVPGSKKRWRELCISELEVWGIPGPPPPPPKPRPGVATVANPAGPRRTVPRVLVGSLEQSKALRLMQGPFQPREKFCEDIEATNRREKEHCEKCEKERAPDAEPCCVGDYASDGTCAPGTFAGPSSLPAGLKYVDLMERKEVYHQAGVCHLLLQTRRGWFSHELGACGEHSMYDQEPQTLINDVRVTVEQGEAARPYLVVQVSRAELTRHQADPTQEETVVELCSVDVAGTPSCSAPVTVKDARPTTDGGPLQVHETATWKILAGPVLEVTTRDAHGGEPQVSRLPLP
jgi:hypothetical protein